MQCTHLQPLSLKGACVRDACCHATVRRAQLTPVGPSRSESAQLVPVAPTERRPFAWPPWAHCQRRRRDEANGGRASAWELLGKRVLGVSGRRRARAHIASESGLEKNRARQSCSGLGRSPSCPTDATAKPYCLFS